MWLRVWLLISGAGALHEDRELDTRWRAKGTVLPLAKVSNHSPINWHLGLWVFLGTFAVGHRAPSGSPSQKQLRLASRGGLGMLVQDVTLPISPHL